MSDALFNSGPARKGFSITPSDTEPTTYVTRGLYLPVAGDVTVVMADDVSAMTTTTFTNLAAGIVHPLAVAYVYDTGTDSITIIGLV
jgi:hypothetical protein